MIASKNATGELSFPMAGGRGASVHSVSAFTSLAAAKRSLAYKQRYGNKSTEYFIVATDKFSGIREEN